MTVDKNGRVAVLAGFSGIKHGPHRSIRPFNAIGYGEEHTLAASAGALGQKAGCVQQHAAIWKFHELRALDAPLIIRVIPGIMMRQFIVVKNFAEALPRVAVAFGVRWARLSPGTQSRLPHVGACSAGNE